MKRITAIVLALLVILCCNFTVFSSAEETNESYLSEEAELKPNIPQRCQIKYNEKFLGEPNTTVVDSSLSYLGYIHFDSTGIADYTVHFSDHGSPAYHTNPHYHTFSVYNGWWTPNVYHSGLPY